MIFSRVFGVLFFFISISSASAAPKAPSALIVVAHPDDEYCLAATVFRIAQELHGRVDLLVITNGEGGYRYSGPSQYVYGKRFEGGEIDPAELPSIRQKELERAGKILGIKNPVFLDQPDFGFTEDAEESLKKWDRKKIDQAILKPLRENRYDVLLTLLPIETTHGQHKAATIFALDAASKIDAALRPLVLGCTNDSDAEEARRYIGMKGYPNTRLMEVSLPPFDRTSPFGFKNQLNYQIYVNWMIAEHKSQGLFQTYFNRDKSEKFYLFDTGSPNASKRAKDFIQTILPPKSAN